MNSFSFSLSLPRNNCEANTEPTLQTWRLVPYFIYVKDRPLFTTAIVRLHGGKSWKNWWIKAGCLKGSIIASNQRRPCFFIVSFFGYFIPWFHFASFFSIRDVFLPKNFVHSNVPVLDLFVVFLRFWTEYASFSEYIICIFVNGTRFTLPTNCEIQRVKWIFYLRVWYNGGIINMIHLIMST